jgi:PIN domain nuclease of toxin-antitoxin system
MKALLDTHTFLWAIAEERKLSRRAQQVFTGPNNLWLSVASVWEILIKTKAGKLSMPKPVGPYLVKKLAQNQIELLPITLDHVLKIESLSPHHRDPFDRLLIAQSIEEGWPIITADPWFARYPVDVIW